MHILLNFEICRLNLTNIVEYIYSFLKSIAGRYFLFYHVILLFHLLIRLNNFTTVKKTITRQTHPRILLSRFLICISISKILSFSPVSKFIFCLSSCRKYLYEWIWYRSTKTKTILKWILRDWQRYSYQGNFYNIRILPLKFGKDINAILYIFSEKKKVFQKTSC